MPTFTPRLLRSISARPALWFGAPLACGVSLVFYFAAANMIEADSRQRFGGHARAAQITITARIKTYTDVLRGAASLFRSTDTVTREQFHAYVTGLDLPRNFPALDKFTYARNFDDGQRDSAMAQLRADQLTVAPDAPPVRLIPPTHRAEYTVVAFVEPEEPHSWSPNIGMDVGANPASLTTLHLMRDTGGLYTSGQPIAAISRPNQIGLGMRLPVFQRGAPIADVAQRRAAYIGSVGIAIHLRTMLLDVLDDLPIRAVRMRVVDTASPDAPVPGRQLFDSSLPIPGRLAPPRAQAASFVETLPVEFHGRHWLVTFSINQRDMYTGFEDYLPWAAMLAGLASTSLLYALYHALSSSRQRAVALARDMTRELRASQSKLELSHQNLRRLAAHADQIKEAERKRIAREIHDDLGQNLLALRIEADMLSNRTRLAHPRLHQRAQMTLTQIDTTIKSVRQIINDLRPNVLDLGLSAAVEWQVGEFRRRSGIECELIDGMHDAAVNDHCATAFFRILQESLSNIVRHARARKVRVALTASDGALRMTVSDDGIGLGAGAGAKSGSFGLVGIEERIHILGGNCDISTGPSGGTSIHVSVPIKPGDPALPARAIAAPDSILV